MGHMETETPLGILNGWTRNKKITKITKNYKKN